MIDSTFDVTEFLSSRLVGEHITVYGNKEIVKRYSYNSVPEIAGVQGNYNKEKKLYDRFPLTVFSMSPNDKDCTEKYEAVITDINGNYEGEYEDVTFTYVASFVNANGIKCTVNIGY